NSTIDAETNGTAYRFSLGFSPGVMKRQIWNRSTGRARAMPPNTAICSRIVNWSSGSCTNSVHRRPPNTDVVWMWQYGPVIRWRTWPYRKYITTPPLGEVFPEGHAPPLCVLLAAPPPAEPRGAPHGQCYCGCPFWNVAGSGSP